MSEDTQLPRDAAGYDDREEIIAAIRHSDLSRSAQHRMLMAFAARNHSAAGATLAGLISKNVAVEFALPLSEWPFPGTPAHLHVYGVEGPLIALGDRPFMGCPPPTPRWVSLGIIKTIRAFGQQ